MFTCVGYKTTKIGPKSKVQNMADTPEHRLSHSSNGLFYRFCCQAVEPGQTLTANTLEDAGFARCTWELQVDAPRRDELLVQACRAPTPLVSRRTWKEELNYTPARRTRIGRSGAYVVLCLLWLLQLCYFSPNVLAQTPPTLPIYINAGSTTPYKAPNGLIYSADQPWSLASLVGYVGGSAASTGMPIEGADAKMIGADLYKTQRRGWQEYRVSALPNGEYVVTLHFAEQEVHGPGLAVFDVFINNQLVLEDFDAVRLAGMEYAIIQRFAVAVTSDELVVRAVPKVGQTHLAAIGIESGQVDETAPPAPAAVESAPSFEASILSWQPNSEPDLAGYHIYRAAAPDGPFWRLTATPHPLAYFVDQFDTTPISTTVPLSATLPVSSTPPLSTTGSVSTTEPITTELPSQTAWSYRVAAVDLYGNESAMSAPVRIGPMAIGSSALPTYQIEVAPADLQNIYQQVEQDIEAPATLTFEQKRYPILLRLRGNFSREFAKKSWEVTFVDASPLADRFRLNLKSHYDDPSLMRGVLTTRIYERMGIAPPSARHSLLFINGEYMGVYTDYEQVDEEFLRRTGRTAGSTIYRTNWTPLGNYGDLLANKADYAQMYTVKTNDHLGYAPIIELVEQINNTPRQLLPAKLYDLLDLNRYLDYYAAVVFTGNMDFTRHNVYLIQDGLSGRWEIVPWDPDFTWGYSVPFSDALETAQPINMGTTENPYVVQGANKILSRTLASRPYQAYYCGRLAELVNENFVNNTMYPLIDRTYRSIEAAARADWHKIGRNQNSRFDAGPQRIKEYTAKRIQFLQAQMGSYCPTEDSFVKLNEVMADNQRSLCDPDDGGAGSCYDDWIELYNPGLTPVDLQGYYISNSPADPTRYQILQTMVMAPLQHALIWADNEPLQGANHAPFQLEASNQPVTLYAPDGVTPVDFFQIDAQGVDQSSGRYPDGGAASRLFSLSTPNARNLLGITFDAITKEPATPSASDAVTVQVTYQSDQELVDSVLHYHLENDNIYQIPMVRMNGNRFVAQIPRQDDGERVEYFVVATSKNGISVASPVNAPNETYSYVVGYQPPALYINEVAAGILEPDGVGGQDAVSWIEIFNAGPTGVRLDGMYLSNNPTQPKMYRIPGGITLAASGYLLFYANSQPDLGPLYTNFSLPLSGGFVGLYDADNEQNPLIDGVHFANHNVGEALQRCTNAPTFWALSTSATPREANRTACLFNFMPISRK